ncbi:MAG TPA: hypothetical protein VJZ71_08380 [Phycisphaerae bacterium]|nr:hypothetical protein [Phycisphaerae bacterium]
MANYRFFAFVLVCAVWAFPRAAVADICMQDVCVRFDPALSEIILGHDFEIDIVADINNPVVGWGLDVTVATGGVISSAGDPDIGPSWFAVNAPDGDKLAGIAFPNGIVGTDVLLATLHFTADADGETDLLLSVTPGDNTEGFALDPSGFGSYLFETGHVSVPEPAGILVMMLSLACACRRRTARRSSRTNP